MRILTYYVACSLDGFIAKADGTHAGFSIDSDYLSDLFAAFPETVPTHLREAFNINADNQWFDTVLMGRKTYEEGLKEGVTSPYSHMKQYLFSRSMTESPDTNVQLISTNAINCIKDLKSESGMGIWLCGGGNFASELFTHNLIDQLIIKMNPFLMGAGIPLFSEKIKQSALELTEHQIYSNGVALLYYKVK